jgi:hypothetical protein
VLVIVVAVGGVAMLAVAEVEMVEVGYHVVTTVGRVDVHVPRMREVESGHRDGHVVDVVDVEVVDVPIVEVIQVAFMGHRDVATPLVVVMLVGAVRPMPERVHQPDPPGSPRRCATPVKTDRIGWDELAGITSRHGTTAPGRAPSEIPSGRWPT